jgi:hypothetical protein
MSAAADRIGGTTQHQKIISTRTPTPRPVVQAERSVSDIAEAIARSHHHLRQAIAEAAYYRAQQRGFIPGHEVEDWLAAQHQIIGASSSDPVEIAAFPSIPR